MKSSYTLRAVDVFCGIGGLTHGLRMAGIDVPVGLDIDSSCQYSYESNNKGTVFLHADVRDVRFEDFEEYYKDSPFKVLVGCAPCQPFSAHTRRRTRTDECELLDEFSRLISEGIPDLVSMENVRGLVKHESFERLLNTLKDLQYTFKYDVLNFLQFGVPQNRRRLVLVASRVGAVRLPTPTYETKSVADFLWDLPLVQAGESFCEDSAHVTLPLSQTNLSRIRQSKPGGTWTEWDGALVNPCQRNARYPAPYGRMSWDKPSPTLTTQFCYYSTGRFGHPEQDRTISLREAALLQTFPRDYKLVNPKSKLPINRVAKHVGNAVPVKIGEHIGKSLRAACVETS